jgi:hypothetical protein
MAAMRAYGLLFIAMGLARWRRFDGATAKSGKQVLGLLTQLSELCTTRQLFRQFHDNLSSRYARAPRAGRKEVVDDDSTEQIWVGSALSADTRRPREAPMSYLRGLKTTVKRTGTARVIEEP